MEQLHPIKFKVPKLNKNRNRTSHTWENFFSRISPICIQNHHRWLKRKKRKKSPTPSSSLSKTSISLSLTVTITNGVRTTLYRTKHRRKKGKKRSSEIKSSSWAKQRSLFHGGRLVEIRDGGYNFQPVFRQRSGNLPVLSSTTSLSLLSLSLSLSWNRWSRSSRQLTPYASRRMDALIFNWIDANRETRKERERGREGKREGEGGVGPKPATRGVH